MKRLWKSGRLFISVLSAMLIFSISFAGCGKSANGSGTLKVGVRSDIINFGYLNEDTGRYYGLEIDIAGEMAKRMGYSDVEFIEVTPDNRRARSDLARTSLPSPMDPPMTKTMWLMPCTPSLLIFSM